MVIGCLPTRSARLSGRQPLLVTARHKLRRLLEGKGHEKGWLVPCSGTTFNKSWRDGGRMEGEPTHVWVSRWNAQRPVNFWGFKQLRRDEVDAMVNSTQGVLLVGGPRSGNMAGAVDSLRVLFPTLPMSKVMQVGPSWASASTCVRNVLHKTRLITLQHYCVELT